MRQVDGDINCEASLISTANATSMHVNVTLIGAPHIIPVVNCSDQMHGNPQWKAQEHHSSTLEPNAFRRDLFYSLSKDTTSCARICI